jgi:indolepyruvate decarboxylase
MSKAESCGTGAYIEVVTDKYVAPPIPMKLHHDAAALYKAA